MKRAHTFHLKPAVFDALTQKARSERRSSNAVVNEILEAYMFGEASTVGLPAVLPDVQRMLESAMSKQASRIAGLQVRIALEAATTRRLALHALVLLLGDNKLAMQFNEEYRNRSIEGLRKRLDDLPELVEAFTAETTTMAGIARSIAPTDEPTGETTDDEGRDGPISA